MYKLFASIYPRQLKNFYTNLLIYSNINVNPDGFLGFIFLFNFLIAAILGILFGRLYDVNTWIFGIFIFVLMYLVLYLWLLVYADKKARLVDEILPDALQLMATNLRAGFTTDRALLLSARPEFGPLEYEINIVGKEITAGKPIEEALFNMTKRVQSETLSRTINLIISGIKSGGKLEDLLQQSSNELKNQKLVDKKIRTSVNMYTIFIFIAIVFGSPVLLGLSTFLVDILVSTLKNVQFSSSVAASFNTPLAVKAINISPSFIFNFALLILITTSIMGAFIIGLISKGKEKEGIKLLPVLLGLSLLVFFLVRYGIQILTAGFFS